MKGIIALMVYLFVGTVSFASEPVTETLQLEQDFKLATVKSQKFSKSQVIIFSANWCAPCVQMQETTLKDAALIGYLNQNSVNTIIDIDSEEGYKMFSKFKVNVLPTIIVTDENGNEIARKKEFLTAENFQKFVQLNSKSADLKNKNVLAANNSTSIQVANLQTVSSLPIGSAIASSSSNPINQVSKKGDSGAAVYGVQIGVFSSMELAVSEILNLQKSIPVRDILILSRNTGDNKQIRLIVGAYLSKENALKVKEELKKEQIDGFLKDLTSI